MAWLDASQSVENLINLIDAASRSDCIDTHILVRIHHYILPMISVNIQFLIHYFIQKMFPVTKKMGHISYQEADICKPLEEKKITSYFQSSLSTSTFTQGQVQTRTQVLEKATTTSPATHTISMLAPTESSQCTIAPLFAQQIKSTAISSGAFHVQQNEDITQTAEVSASQVFCPICSNDISTLDYSSRNVHAHACMERSALSNEQNKKRARRSILPG